MLPLQRQEADRLGHHDRFDTCARERGSRLESHGRALERRGTDRRPRQANRQGRRAQDRRQYRRCHRQQHRSDRSSRRCCPPPARRSGRSSRRRCCQRRTHDRAAHPGATSHSTTIELLDCCLTCIAETGDHHADKQLEWAHRAEPNTGILHTRATRCFDRARIKRGETASAASRARSLPRSGPARAGAPRRVRS